MGIKCTITLILIAIMLFFSYSSVSGFWIDYRDGTPAEDTIDFTIPDSYFIRNEGQIVSDEIIFYSRGGNVFFTSTGVYFRFRECSPVDNHGYHEEGVVLKYCFPNAKPTIPEGIDQCLWNTNYFKGSDPAGWFAEVQNYERVMYKDLWDGIDLVYYIQDGNIKYDVYLHAGSNLKSLSFEVRGSNGLSIDENGDLVIRTEYRDIVDGGMISYYADDPKERVESKFSILSGSRFTMEIMNYDPNRDVVIDPTLSYSTFIGASGSDIGKDIFVEANGLSYLTGSTRDVTTDFPTTTGAYDVTHNGNNDVYVLKFNRTSSSLVFSTFLGGSGWDNGYSLYVDQNKDVYVTGYTEDSTIDFPTTSGAYDTTHNGNGDVFVTKLKSTGSSLSYSTFLGGSKDEYGFGITVDKNGVAYVVGNTLSSDFPTTSGAYDTTYDGDDVFFTKVNASGGALSYSTFIGGTGIDSASDICLDDDLNAYITGSTYESGTTKFPTTSGAYDTTYNGEKDVFVLKMNVSGKNLDFSTYIGGASTDSGSSIDIDPFGYVYITGYTAYSSTNTYPTTMNAFDTSHNGYDDGFVTKLNPTGSSLVFSTFIGGSNDDRANDIIVDSALCIHIVGQTVIPNPGKPAFPTTSNAYDSSHNGIRDTFYSKFNSNGSKLYYSTLIGGSAEDEGYSIGLDNAGGVYITGATYDGSTDYPTTTNAYDTTQNGLFDVFLSIFEFDRTPPTIGNDSTPTKGTTGDTFTFKVNVSDNIQVGDVYVEYWFGSSGQYLNRSMSGTDSYSYDINVPNDSLEDIYYVFHAVDMDSNWASSSKKAVKITDNDNPIINDLTEVIGYTGNIFGFKADITDNIDVDSAWVLYWFGSGSKTNMSMKETDKFTLNISIPAYSIDPLYYRIMANDTSNNWVIGPDEQVLIIDDDLPEFSNDLSPGYGTTGDPITFSIDVHDNIEVKEVWLEYRFGSGMTFDIQMEDTGPYTLEMVLPWDSIDILYYVFKAVDLSENWNRTTEMMVEIIDNDAPFFINDSTPGIATTGDEFTFQIELDDNIGISNVFLEYWFGDGDHHNVSSKDAFHFLHSIVIPSGSLEELHYKFSAVDDTSNWNSTSVSTIKVFDNDLPFFGDDTSNEFGTTGDEFIFSIETFDNIMIYTVSVEYWFGEGSHENMSMSYSDRFTLKIVVPEDSVDDLHYVIHAIDSSGNWNNTPERIVRIIDNDKPFFTSIGIPLSIGTGEIMCSQIVVGDNIGVSTVHVEYWFGNGAHENISIGDGNSYECNWDLEIPSESIENLNYKLSVSDHEGNWLSIEGIISIIDTIRPRALIGQDITVNEDEMVLLNGSASEDNIGIANFSWVISGGSIDTVLFGISIGYVFEEPGNYFVYLNVTDDQENWDRAYVNITVLDVTIPVVMVKNMVLDEDEITILDGSLCWDNVGIVNWTWTVEGKEKYGMTIEHVFTEPGIFNISLKVTDDAGNFAQGYAVITIKDVTDPIVVAGPDQTVVAGSVVYLQGSGSDNVGIVNWTWTFNDGKTEWALYGSTVEHNFTLVGNYTITLNGFDALGNSGSSTLKVNVEPEKPIDKKDPSQDKSFVDYWWIGVGIIILLILIGIALFFFSKKNDDEPETEGGQNEQISSIEAEDYEHILKDEYHPEDNTSSKSLSDEKNETTYEMDDKSSVDKNLSNSQ